METGIYCRDRSLRFHCGAFPSFNSGKYTTKNCDFTDEKDRPFDQGYENDEIKSDVKQKAKQYQNNSNKKGYHRTPHDRAMYFNTTSRYTIIV